MSEALKEFARTVIREECWGYQSLDGLEIQDLAVNLGLLAEHIATEEDVDGDVEVGDKIYKFTQALKETS